jgi:hypothetical protein
MPIDNPQYDVAISFLSKDEPIATAIHQNLTEGLKVFFFPRNQEELAGTDGLESMRTPFFDDSRVMVVLYREPWGKTPWTRVEETAIKESCLEYGWQRLFFIVLDRESSLPIWLPKNYVRFNFADFGLEQAIGAIKARVQENGGQYLPPTPAKRAEIFKAEELFRRDKGRMNSVEGTKAIFSSVADLFSQVERDCADISERGLLQIRYAKSLQEGRVDQRCSMTDDHVGLAVAWLQRYSSNLVDAYLVVREFAGGLILPGEGGQRVYFRQPRVVSETRYLPDLSFAREYGWTEVGGSEFVSSSTLADRCVIRFVDLARAFARGEISDAT